MMADRDEISKAFNTHAYEYDKAAKAQYEIGTRLLERLHYLNIDPKYILDLGCGTGLFSKQLGSIFPKARIIGLDIAFAMLCESLNKQGWRRKWSLVVGDMNVLPFSNGVFDLVFSNQVIHWSQDIRLSFREINRVMNPNGCFVFSTLGPDTFTEMNKAWSGVNTYAHVNEFADMHDIGDSLMKEHFLDPVMDMELLSMHYESFQELINALKSQGVKNVHSQRNQGLTGKNAWKQFETNFTSLKTEEGYYPLSYEVVYGIAWKGAQRKTDNGIETMIPVSSLLMG